MLLCVEELERREAPAATLDGFNLPQLQAAAATFQATSLIQTIRDGWAADVSRAEQAIDRLPAAWQPPLRLAVAVADLLFAEQVAFVQLDLARTTLGQRG